MPFNILYEWLEDERQLGVPEPDSAILSTFSANMPHGRVVAIREIKDESLIFFTSSQTRKATELFNNHAATMTFWFAMQRRQVILDGFAHPLTEDENQHYWSMLPRERQLRFLSYAPFSGQVIQDLTYLYEIKNNFSRDSFDQSIPLSEFYKGFCFVPQTLIFYTSRPDDFADVFRFEKSNGNWEKQHISP